MTFRSVLLAMAVAVMLGNWNMLMRRIKATNMLRLTVRAVVLLPIPVLLSVSAEKPARISQSWQNVSLHAVPAVVNIVWISRAIGFSIWDKSLRQYSTSLVSVFADRVPIFGMLTSWLVLGAPLAATLEAARCRTADAV